jgi:hypothetical protein
MDDRLSRLESRVEALLQTVADLQRRLTAVEAGAAEGWLAADSAAQQAARSAPQARASSAEATPPLSLVGRTLMVFGGAYLLRAFTADWGLLPLSAGVALGLLYASAWIVMADRAGAAGQRASAGFHGLSAVLIACPLILEATVKFRLLSPPALSAAVLALFTALALVVASRQRLGALAWVATGGSLVTAFLLMMATKDLVAFSGFLIPLGVAALWLGYLYDWRLLRWPAAMCADMAVAALMIRAAAARGPDSAAAVILVQLALVAAYLGSVVTRTLFLDRDVILFEVVQSAAVLLVGFGGAAYVAYATGSSIAAFGVASLVFGAGSYAVAFAFVERRVQGRKNFYFYSSLAIVFAIVGTAFLLPAPTLGLLWGALSIIAVWIGWQFSRATLSWHGMLYGVGASLASGLLLCGSQGLVRSAGQPWPAAGPAELIVLLMLAVSGGLTAPVTVARPYGWIPKFTLFTLVAWSIAGVVVMWLTPALAGTPGSGADAGVIATIRTAVLIAVLLLMGWLGRYRRLEPARRLVNPLLIATGVKMVVEDFQTSRPATLFLALALLGAALIVAPRLSRRHQSTENPP